MPWSGELWADGWWSTDIAVVAAIHAGLLLRLVVVEAAVIVLGLGLFLGHGAWVGWTAPRTARRLASGRDVLQSALEEDGAEPRQLRPLAQLPRRLQIAVLAGVAPRLAGAQRRRLTALADDLGVLTDAAARCRSRRWWRRLQGARLCTLLGGGEESVPALLGDRRPEVRAQAAQWAVEHHDDEVVDRLLRILDVDDDSTRFAVKDSLIRIGRPVTERLAPHLSVRAGRSLRPALEVAVALPDPVLLPAALTLCDDEEPSIRALAAALAGAIGGGPTVEVLTRLLGDDAPEVRAAAARALGRAGHWPAAASLAALLGDRSWEVRQKAAVALRTLGSPGMLFLRRALSADDPFAADAARQMLELPRQRPAHPLMALLHAVLERVESVILVYFLMVNSLYAVLLASAAWDMRSYRLRSWHEDQSRLLGSAVGPRISMLAPAHNEGATVAESVRSLLTLRYPNLEVVVVNDGSTDETMTVLKQTFDLVAVHPISRRMVDHKPILGIYRSAANPGLVVVDKENGGKADALNAGMNVASGDLACAIDADTLIEADALLRLVAPFLTDDDVVAAGGTIRVVNAAQVRAGRVLEARVPHQVVPGIQVVEYLRAFLVGRLGWNRLGGNLIISGAFGLFRRDAVLSAGGYTEGTVGEDMELVVRLRRRGLDNGLPHRVVFVPDPVAWTEVPSSMKVLGRQRDRWHRGLSDVVWRNRGLLLNPRYRSLGLAVFPYYVFVELLAPVVEAFGLLGLALGVATGGLDLGFAALFFLVAYGFALVLDVLTLLMEELSYRRYHRMSDRLLLLLWGALGSVGYRQCTVYWRLRGIKKFLQKRTDWGTMTRTGFQTAETPQPGADPGG